MINLILADPDLDFAKEIQLVVAKIAKAKIVAVTQNLDQLPSLTKKHYPAIVFLGPNFNVQSISELLYKEAPSFMGRSVIVFTKEHSEEIDVPQGISLERLSPPLHPQDLVDILEKLSGKSSTSSFPALAKTVTVFSTKGGVGKTMIASNLAVYLAKNTGKRVVVLDLDLQFGDIGVMLKLRPEYTIYDCVPITNELNEELIEKFLTPHSSGARALLAPLQPEYADLVTAEHLKNVLEVLRHYADIVIVDTPASFNDHVLALLDQTDIVLLIGTMDIPSVKNVKLCLQTLQSLQYPDDKIALTINRADENVGLKQNEIEQALNRQAVVTIPTDKRVPLSINKGTPIALEAPKSPAARALIKLAEYLVKRLKTGKEAYVAA